MTTESSSPLPGTRCQPDPDCRLCPRLAEFLGEQRLRQPAWHNRPVAAFGDRNASLLVVGLAPGVSGANRTGRPFTGDFAGKVLYSALARHGWSNDRFDERVDDGLELSDCRIVNAVRCVPPANRPTGAEIRTCRRFLVDEIEAEPRPRILLTLGRIAHLTVLRVLGMRDRQAPFAHAAAVGLADGRHVVSSYHCSRYNVNTGRLTEAMFDDVMTLIDRLRA
ncbi:MAG: uracil-DNA glycosylase [Geminicoccaceae bacterium]